MTKIILFIKVSEIKVLIRSGSLRGSFLNVASVSAPSERSAAMPGSLEEEVQLRRWDVETTAVLAHLPSAFSYRGKPQARDSTTVQPKSSSATASLLLCLACLLLGRKYALYALYLHAVC